MSCFRCLLLIPLITLGCQGYAPEPLDLDTHRRVFESRTPSSSEVIDYAQRLSHGSSAATA